MYEFFELTHLLEKSDFAKDDEDTDFVKVFDTLEITDVKQCVQQTMKQKQEVKCEDEQNDNTRKSTGVIIR